MIPSSTYRLQLHKGFTFDDAGSIADYLKALGVFTRLLLAVSAGRAGQYARL